jgi:2-polyprenyl-3-methyl-5-hydroxy-6-metoxy-1,4-benzoquinol methylase
MTASSSTAARLDPAASVLNASPGETLAACPICACTASILISRDGVLYSRLAERTTVVSNICPSCGVIYNNPRLSRETLHRFYEREWAKRNAWGSAAPLVAAPESGKTARRVEFVLPLLPAHGRVLEIGSGNCNVVASLARRLPAARVTGVDPAFAEDATPLPNLRLIADRIDDTRLPPALSPPYDCVIAFHVLEHQHSPTGFLDQLTKLLAPEGVLYLEIPNTYRPFWWGKDVETYFNTAHLFNFGRRSLEFLLAKSGLVPLAWDTSNRKALRVISTVRSGAADHATPRPVTPAELTAIRRYFRLWKAYSVLRRVVPLPHVARGFGFLAWQLVGRRLERL